MLVAGTIRFYLDENVQVAVAEQLRRRGIDVVTVSELGFRGKRDEEHLAHAADMNCVLCTYDPDFARLASIGVEHAGIVLGRMRVHGIGHWVRALIRIHAAYTPDTIRNHIEYL